MMRTARRVENEKENAWCDDSSYRRKVTAITGRSLTELFVQQQNNQPQELNSAKDKYFSIIVHDQRSPLDGFPDLAQVMLNESKDFSEFRLMEFGKTMHDSLQSFKNSLKIYWIGADVNSDTKFLSG